jgi:hypothetical protein
VSDRLKTGVWRTRFLSAERWKETARLSNPILEPLTDSTPAIRVGRLLRASVVVAHAWARRMHVELPHEARTEAPARS